ncbi:MULTISPECIES: LysR family transcriptional regulator [unclassified Dehalobacter]|jgi:DNA-binding transcriptional LysR family regulator|uniref:LysR family transcriptional regulator n=1 Tax=unclassified Dehalobacter TaxID=2635733 RepID=UPI000E6C28A2|nr:MULTISPECIES: LysR family transcriptional regulator [unclassified Dehalobacter]RJE46639.1 LysR family transcriptional regulator [Dehalobacter sp. MCB1]TCX47405.1 LysR family transcriptional regulator [Dehalobacter sp. 14DCB1]TCX55618.1 LysR family transcriptional regulator [Dehalobacter sp. 12DCB1]
MTLQQLKYIVTIAECGSINEAAKQLFISQPSLSNAIKEVELEAKRTLFLRTPRGMQLTEEGMEFLGYARQVLQQMDMLEGKYLNEQNGRQRFSVSTQHYTFAANALVEMVKQFGGEVYDFTLYEGTTHDIIENVKNLRSDLGIIYLSYANETVIRKLLSDNDLKFKHLFTAKPHVFLFKNHPLASKDIVTLDELENYPYITYNQGIYNSFYYSEEILSTRTVAKQIRVSDRAAVVNFIIGLNAYTISSGVFPAYLHGNDIIAVQLDVDEKIEIGTIMHKDIILNELGHIYLAALEKYAEDI